MSFHTEIWVLFWISERVDFVANGSSEAELFLQVAVVRSKNQGGSDAGRQEDGACDRVHGEGGPVLSAGARSQQVQLAALGEEPGSGHCPRLGLLALQEHRPL